MKFGRMFEGAFGKPERQAGNFYKKEGSLASADNKEGDKLDPEEKTAREASKIWAWFLDEIKYDSDLKAVFDTYENLVKLFELGGRGDQTPVEYYFETRKWKMQRSGDWDDEEKRAEFKNEMQDILDNLRKLKEQIEGRKKTVH